MIHFGCFRRFLLFRQNVTSYENDYFCMKTAQLMGMMAVALGGVDGMVFTGGIGENSSLIRDKILGHLAFLKPFESCVIPANEERVMAMHTLSILKVDPSGEPRDVGRQG